MCHAREPCSTPFANKVSANTSRTVVLENGPETILFSRRKRTRRPPFGGSTKRPTVSMETARSSSCPNWLGPMESRCAFARQWITRWSYCGVFSMDSSSRTANTEKLHEKKGAPRFACLMSWLRKNARKTLFNRFLRLNRTQYASTSVVRQKRQSMKFMLHLNPVVAASPAERERLSPIAHRTDKIQ